MRERRMGVEMRERRMGVEMRERRMGVEMRDRRMGGTELNEREIADGRRGEEN
jgi:hypothetical protein